jgi:hypothetical protein
VPIPFAPLVGFLLGAVLAWVAAPELGRDEGPVVASRPFAVVVAFAVLVFTPIVGYFAAFHGDWAYLYAVRWRHVPSAVDLALVLASGATIVAAFLLAAPFVRKRRFGAVTAMVIAPGVAALALLPLAAHRLSLSATYAQYHGDFGTEPTAASALGRGVLLMGIVLTLALVWTVRAFWAINAESRR